MPAGEPVGDAMTAAMPRYATCCRDAAAVAVMTAHCAYFAGDVVYLPYLLAML
jgi:hypothetical protein